MTSATLLDNRYFDKKIINRLETQSLKTNDTYPERTSYLFSLVISQVTFNKNRTGGDLTFMKNDVKSIIQFSDRPFRKTKEISYEKFIELFTINGSNSFDKDPPNIVINYIENNTPIQKTYTMSLINEDELNATFRLELLPGEIHNETNISSQVNLFVDGIFGDIGDFVSRVKRTVENTFDNLKSKIQSITIDYENNLDDILNNFFDTLSSDVNNAYNQYKKVKDTLKNEHELSSLTDTTIIGKVMLLLQILQTDKKFLNTFVTYILTIDESTFNRFVPVKLNNGKKFTKQNFENILIDAYNLFYDIIDIALSPLIIACIIFMYYFVSRIAVH